MRKAQTSSKTEYFITPDNFWHIRIKERKVEAILFLAIIGFCSVILVLFALAYDFNNFFIKPAIISYKFSCEIDGFEIQEKEDGFASNVNGITINGVFSSNNSKIWIKTDISESERKQAIKHENCHKYWNEKLSFFKVTCNKPEWVVLEEMTCYMRGAI